MEKLQEDEYGEVIYDATVPCIILRSKGFANTVHFRSLLESGWEAYREKAKIHAHLGWISDTRMLGAISEADFEWLKTDWIPRMFAAGVRCAGLLQPDNIFGELALQRIRTQLLIGNYKDLETQVFPALLDAKDWIRATCLSSGQMLFPK